MTERLTFTLAGRDELTRVMNGTADSADRLRLRLAGITTDADGNLRNLQGQFLSLADAQRLVDDRASIVRRSMTNLSDSADKLGESLKANLISLLPAAIPAAAGLAGSASVLAGQLGAVGVAAGAYALALGPQVSALGEAVDAQQKYEEAVEKSGATSQEAIKAQLEYERQLAKLPPATREAAVAVGLLKDNYKDFSDALAEDTMAPFTKGVAVANELLPKTTGLVKGASAQFDRLITLVGGAISTPGFDAFTGRFTDFTTNTLDHGIDRLTVFLAKLESGDFDGGQLQQWWDYAQAAGPLVFDTLENVAEALLNVLEAGSGVGVGMLEVVNVLSDIVSAVPPEAIATLLQLAIAVKAVNLAAAGGAAASAAVAALGVQIGAMRAAAQGAPGALAATSAAIGTLSKTAKLAIAGTGIGLLLIGLDVLASKSRNPAPDVDKLTVSLRRLGQEGKVTGEAAKHFGTDLGGLYDKVRSLTDPSTTDDVQQFIVTLGGLGDWDSTPVKEAKENIDSIDKALANLVAEGNPELAASALERLTAEYGKGGRDVSEFTGELNDYEDALKGQRLEQELAAASMGLFGEQAQKVQAKLEEQRASADGLRQAIQALNDVNRQGLSGMIGFEAALDAASKAAAENAGVLNMQGGQLVLNTEKQRAAATSLNDLAAKTDEAAGAARESGATWETVNGIYERGRKQLIANAMQMGLTRQEAKALADQILKTPDKTARLKGNLEDLKAKLAEAKERLRKAPSEKRAHIRGEIEDLKRKIRQATNELAKVKDKSVTITAHYRSDGASFLGASGRYATGGLVGYPGGGLIGGEGTDTSDSNLILASRNEYIVRAAAVREYGVDFMDAINSMTLPTGRGAPRQGLPAAPAATKMTASSGHTGVTYNVYPRASVITVEDLRLIQRQEEARQRVGRAR